MEIVKSYNSFERLFTPSRKKYNSSKFLNLFCPLARKKINSALGKQGPG